MSLKMKELMLRTGESKSTLLYYLKEGLLPAPQKPKPNVHLYDESCVQIVRFIKYLQHNFSYSIAEIKTIFQHNRFQFDDSFEMIIHSLELIAGAKTKHFYTKEAFLDTVGISEEQLMHYEEQGYLFSSSKR